jgi:hypothetical protein
VFGGDPFKRVVIGYMYGGIHAPASTLITPGQNYTSTANRKLYKVYMKIAGMKNP